MCNSVNNSKYAAAIDVSPPWMNYGGSIFGGNYLSQPYNDMYQLSRPLGNRSLDKYRRPESMKSANKRIAAWALGAYAVVGLITRGASIRLTGKALKAGAKGIVSVAKGIGKGVLSIFGRIFRR